jgi:hypothetical protein
MPRPAPIPIFHYTVTLKDGTTRECNAMQYAVDGGWFVFDAPDGTVLSLRAENVDEVTRSPEPVATREVDHL